MKLPFTTEQFLNVFEAYNTAIWPLQVGLYILAVGSVYLFSKRTIYNKTITVVLSFLWIWMGVVYHVLYFSVINKAALIFGVAFFLQGLMFLYFGIFRRSLSFKLSRNLYSIIGVLFIFYALVVYPVLGYNMGRVYPESPTFGLPCPTTIFTFGILLMAVKKLPYVLLIIPFIWSIIGFSAAFTLGIIEDTGLIIAGISSTVLIIYKNKKGLNG